jgi:hypothetical protein
MTRIISKHTSVSFSIAQLVLSFLFLSVLALPAISINPDEIPKGTTTLPQPPEPLPLPAPLPAAPPPAPAPPENPAPPESPPAPVTPQVYYPPEPSAPAPAPSPVPAPAPSQPVTTPQQPTRSSRDVVGCNDKGHSTLVRQIEIGELIPCVLSQDSFRQAGRPIHIYEFQGNVNQAVVVKLIGGKPGDWQLNPYLVLLGPDRQVIAADDNTSRLRVAEAYVRLPATGTYTILASSSKAGEFGRYGLVVERDREQYSFDQFDELTNRSRKLKQDNSAYDTSEFQAEQGNVITIRASSSSFFPALVLLDPDGQLVARNDNKAGSRNITLEHKIAKSGTYTVVVNSLRPSDRGSYRLTIKSNR